MDGHYPFYQSPDFEDGGSGAEFVGYPMQGGNDKTFTFRRVRWAQLAADRHDSAADAEG
ncbi:hypothetical protein ACU4GD_36225 [Cupriavidus basilensis]